MSLKSMLTGKTEKDKQFQTIIKNINQSKTTIYHGVREKGFFR
jgi:hypothetical protein